MRHWPVLIALACAVFAFRDLPGLAYTGVDSQEWLLRSDLRDDGALEWIFARPHLIGYRPLTALSYALDTLQAKLEPATYHVTDLVLHGCVVVLVYALGLSLLGRSAAVVAALFVGLHPLATHVVPVLARRGDLLVTVLSLCAVWLACRGRALACGIATGLAFASKEVAVILPAVIGVTGWLTATPFNVRRGARLAGAASLGIAALGAMRLVLVGRIGGYRSPDHSPLWRIAAEFLTNLWLPTGQIIPAAGHEQFLGFALLVVSVASLAICVWRTARSPSSHVRVALAIAATWFGCQLVLWLALPRPFEVRLLYPSLPPLALLFGAALTERSWVRSVLWLPVAVAVFAVVTGPLFRGLPEWQAASHYQRCAIDELERRLNGQEDQVVVAVNQPGSVSFDPAMRSAQFGSDGRSIEAASTRIFDTRQLGTWIAARRGLPIALLDMQRGLRTYPLNFVMFCAAEAKIPVSTTMEDTRLVVTLGAGLFRSYLQPDVVGRGATLDVPNQPLLKSRPELRIPKTAKLFVFDGERGELRPFPALIEIRFAASE